MVWENCTLGSVRVTAVPTAPTPPQLIHGRCKPAEKQYCCSKKNDYSHAANSASGGKRGPKEARAMALNSTNLKVLVTPVILVIYSVLPGGSSFAQTSGVPFSFLPREPDEIPTYVVWLDGGLMSHELQSVASPAGGVTLNCSRVFSVQVNGGVLGPTSSGSAIDLGYSVGAAISVDLNPATREDVEAASHKPLKRFQIGASYTKLNAKNDGHFAETNIPVAYVLMSTVSPISGDISAGRELAIRAHWRIINDDKTAQERKNDIGAGATFTLGVTTTGTIGIQLRNEFLLFFRNFRSEFGLSAGIHFRF